MAKIVNLRNCCLTNILRLTVVAAGLSSPQPYGLTPATIADGALFNHTGLTLAILKQCLTFMLSSPR